MEDGLVWNTINHLEAGGETIEIRLKSSEPGKEVKASCYKSIKKYTKSSSHIIVKCFLLFFSQFLHTMNDLEAGAGF